MSEIETAEGSLYYETRGEGPAVLLVHGAVASARQVAPLAERLSGERLTVSFDLPGMGRSGPASPATSAGTWVADIHALLDHLALDRVHVAGVSLGARVALRFALDHPERVATLALDAPLTHTTPEAERWLEVQLSEDMPEPFAELVEQWQGRPDWRDVVAWYRRLRARADFREHLDLRARLGEVAVPVLVTRGDVDDPVHSLAHALAVHGGCRRSWLWIRPDTSFSTVLAAPEEFAALHARFVQALGDEP